MSNSAVAYAVAALGKPYVFATPRPITTQLASSYDCSGLTSCCWLTIGKTITPYTVAQYAETNHRPIGQAQPGDLIYYRDGTGYIYHVAIVEGPGQLIEAPEPGKNVQRRAYTASDKDIMQTVSAIPIAQGPPTSIPPTDLTGTPNTTAPLSGSVPSATKFINWITSFLSKLFRVG